MQKEKILVVDDEKNICDLLRMYLEKEGYSVVMAHNAIKDTILKEYIFFIIITSLEKVYRNCEKNARIKE